MILVPKRWTKRDIARNAEHAGRRTGLPAGGYMSDLVALRKAIVLCWRCRRKFNAKAAHYTKHPNIPFVRFSRCDGCRELAMKAELFIHEEMNYL